MRHSISLSLIRLSILAIALWCSALTASAQTTAFSYQGQLNDGGSPANGSYDLQFKLFDALTAGTQVGPTVPLTNVTVTNGVFAVTLDFGAVAFSGANRWLEISVRLAGGGAFTTLTPRQPLTSTPYAIKSLSAASADGLSVSCVSCVTSAQIGSLPANSGNYIQNTTTQQTANFNISGNGSIGGKIGIGIGPDLAQRKLHVVESTSNLLFGHEGAAVLRITNSTPSSIAALNLGNTARDWQLRIDGTDANKFRIYDATAIAPRLTINTDGNVGIGATSPDGALHLSSGGSFTAPQLIVNQTNSADYSRIQLRLGNTPKWEIAGNPNELNFWDNAASTNRLTIKNNGNVGIGTTNPDEKLTVAGRIFSTGGFLFPDSTLQTTANAIEAITNVTYPTNSIEIAPNEVAPSVTTIGEVTLNVPGYYLIMATASFYNGAILPAQDNSRECRCSLSEQTQAGSIPSPYTFTLDSNQDQVVNWHWVASSFTTNNIRITCKAISGGTDRSYVYASRVRLTAIKIGSLALQ